MVGSTEFPRIGELPYFLTLAPYGFYWFQLAEAPAPPVVERPAPRSAPKPPSALDLPPLLLGVVWDTAFTTATHEILERDYLPVHLATRRWFAAKARPLSKVLIRDHALVRGGAEPVFLTLLDVRYGDGGSEVYALPMAFLGGKAADDLLRDSPELVIARVSGARKGVLHERLDWGVASLLLDAIAGGLSFNGPEGRFVASRTSAFDALRGPIDPASPLPVHRSSSEQSNTSFIFGEQLILKLIRRVEPGPNPELEISYHLTERVQFPRAPRLAGAIEYEERDGTRSTLAVLHGLVPYQATGWEQALSEAGRYLEDAASEAGPPPDPGEIAAEVGLLLPGNVRVPPGVADHLGWYVDAVLRLGRRTADLHLALASAHDAKDFDPEPLTREDLSATIAGIRTLATQMGQLLATQLTTLAPPVQEMATVVVGLLPDVVNDLDRAITKVPAGLVKTRIHGDYHLGQVLWDSGDVYIIDFEGEPGRALSERRVRQSPLKDVAGMVRSFSYASQAALAAWRTHHPEDGTKLVGWAHFWETNVSRIFVQGYRAAAGSAVFVPEEFNGFTALCRIYLVEKALYELRYELNNRPDWLHIPLAGLIELLDKGPGA
jgi:maltose alpha-D-glucosyltransferase/alpha-amylase